LLVINDQISNALQRSKYLPLIKFDITKAFDRVPHHRLLRKLSAMGLCDGPFHLIESFLMNREHVIVHNGVQSLPFSPPSGVPQGSILGPLLYKCYADDLLVEINDKFCYVNLYGFADDLLLALLSSIDDLKSNIYHSQLQHILSIMEEWGK